MAKTRSSLITALDIGTSKTVCFIARVVDGAKPEIIGIGHQVSKGMRHGNIVDMDQLEMSILNAVHGAEKMANETIRDLTVNITSGHIVSRCFEMETEITGHEVTEHDVRRAVEQGRDNFFKLNTNDATTNRWSPKRVEHELLHTVPISYTIDGNHGIRDPHGMHGQRLGAQTHLISAQTGAIQNLTTTIKHCHLDIDDIVVSPYASGLACLVDDEMDLGVTMIDMGGGTTSVAVFYEGAIVYTDVIPVGGDHVTSDLARGLSTTLTHAERLKTLYGSTIPSSLDEKEMIDVPQVGEEDDDTPPNQISRSTLINIIRPRLEETFEMVKASLDRTGFSKIVGRRAVLTGGACQLPGTRELASLTLDKQIRIGKPIRVEGLAESTGGPAFSTAAGLIAYASGENTHMVRTFKNTYENKGLSGFVKKWFGQAS